MVRVMNPAGQFLFLLICCLFSGRQVAGSPEPVFIKHTDVAPSNSLVTQTVYGFLDFTTTIGNTIMVFSPQSIAADNGKDKTTESVVNEVIDTKPVTSVETQPPPTIKPSKTVTNDGKKSSDTPKDIYTVVNVQQKPTSVVSIKSDINLQPSSKVNIIEGTKSVVNVLPVTKTSQLKNVVTKVEVITGTVEQKQPAVMSSIVQTVKSDSTSVVSQIEEVPLDKDEPAIAVGNNIGEPEYDFLSRQPSEVVEETYKVVNLKQSTKFHLKPRPTVDPKTKPTRSSAHPTGLVTKLGGTVIKDGVTTVHETSVIGTYISGKYAQVLQSTSHVTNNHPKGKINPSPSLRILKTAAPNIGKSNNKHQHLESTQSLSNDEVSSVENSHHSHKSHKKSKNQSNSSKPRPKHPSRDHEVENHDDVVKSVTPQPGYKKSRSPTRSPPTQHNTSHRPHKSNKKHGRKRARLATVSVHSEPPPTTPTPTVQPAGRKFSPRKTKSKPTTTSAENTNNVYSKKNFKARNQIQPTEPTSAENSSIYKFKLNRTPGRWQYKTTPKPRITIRKQNDEEQNNVTLGATTSPVDVHPHLNDIVRPQVRPDEADSLVGSESIASITGDENSVENKIDKLFPLETIKVEISTPPDFKDTYYEIATIKSPYVFQAGNAKNTRFITITSTFEKVLDSTTTDTNINPSKSEPLTENILATSHNYEKDNNFLDSSIATLPPLYMATDMETPPLETVTETFSTTQTMLKTHILPAIRSQNETLSYTLIQTYVITRFVTATKTLPPMEAYHFVPTRILKDFNSHLDEAGSELNLELAFGDDNDNLAESQVRKSLPADLDLAQIGSDFDLSEVDKLNIPMEMHLRSKKAHPPKQRVEQPIATPNLSPEQLQQLALLRLLNPGVGALQPQVITTSKPVIKVETVYESHVIPVINGHNTFLTTISRSVGLATKTDYDFGTSTVAPQLPNLQIPPINPLFQQQQQQYAITTSPIVQTTQITHTNSKVLKLTFGAKTAHTTIISTTVIPTVLTTFITGSIAVQPTAAFPGFFPAPYAPYPYVG